ncbi:uncharacterized protein B0H18DRAFT_691004 [Fomitopsis serialis]|uniref:uncharacterized protein n=1 Tax=Fomitopsis serialis TaxID=139415 RepID=UPI002007531E|nr:uncharacterized protein B0H18DRAFT_691004 [Neoantrodia serialis]KAH9917609.1 hypothetical protein B0H18DRAFT_691004 [Neoantrodia serialis]
MLPLRCLFLTVTFPAEELAWWVDCGAEQRYEALPVYFLSPSSSPVRVAILTALLARCVVRSVFLFLSYTYFHTSCAIKKVRLLCVRGSGTHDRSAPCSRLCHHPRETRRGGASRSAMRNEARPEILSLRNPCVQVARAMLVVVIVSAGLARQFTDDGWRLVVALNFPACLLVGFYLLYPHFQRRGTARITHRSWR